MVTMEWSGSYKKATAALDEAAKARLRGPFASDIAPSSAAPGRADADDDLVDEFYNGYGEHGVSGGVAKGDGPPRPTKWKETLRETLVDAAADVVATRIRAEAERAVRDADPDVVGGCRIRKRLVERLSAKGFNAGLCRSSWERTSSIPAPGKYEYVDVTMGSSSSSAARYIVEVNVAAEFEIARPTADYQDLLLSLPPVLVASPDALKQVAAADALKQIAAAAESIRGAGMHVPPWRRARYVQAKWSGQYERVEAVAPVAARKNCGMETGRREVAMGREALVSMRPLFRGL